MKTIDYLLIGGAAYLILSRPGYITGGSSPAGGTVVTGPAGSRAASTPQQFAVDVPGVGSYRNVYGQGTSFTINPDFFSSIGELFRPKAPEPVDDPNFVYAAADPWAATYYPPPPQGGDPYWYDTSADFYGAV